MLLAVPLSAKVVDKTVAMVNGEAIMFSDYDKLSAPVMEQYKMATPPADQTPAKEKELKGKLLDQMIDDKVMKQEAEKQKIRVSKRDIEEGMKQVRSRFASEAEFQAELKKEDISLPQFEKRIEEQLMVMKLVEQEVKAKAAPPQDEDVRKLFEQIQAKAEGKELGIDQKQEEELAQLSKVFSRVSSEQVRARHILIQVDKNAPMNTKSAALTKIKKIQKELKGGADFADLAKKYSEDPGSKQRGGDLGYFTKGDMVPEFEKAAFTLNVGQVSEPVLTDFGYHLIRVEERKASKKLTYEEVENDLKQYLFQRSAQTRYEGWLKDLRAKATIKINQLD